MSVTAERSALALVLEVTTITHTQPFRYIRHSLMFSKIPHKFSAPFGLLGDEAKLAFPTQPGGISKLATVRVRMLLSVPVQRSSRLISNPGQNIPASDSYWDQVCGVQVLPSPPLY